MVGRIRRRIERLGRPGLAYLGRPALFEGTRELVEAPDIIVDELRDARDELVVLAIFHGAQSR
jgi:plasmid stabilization system protein ParE